jgi:hypothetical protein
MSAMATHTIHLDPQPADEYRNGDNDTQLVIEIVLAEIRSGVLEASRQDIDDRNIVIKTRSIAHYLAIARQQAEMLRAGDVGGEPPSAPERIEHLECLAAALDAYLEEDSVQMVSIAKQFEFDGFRGTVVLSIVCQGDVLKRVYHVVWMVVRPD